jgi:periplasmic protein TonB
MTLHTFDDNPFAQNRRRAMAGRALGVLALLVIGYGIWVLANKHEVRIKKEEPVSSLMAVAPPPPPPPPPPKPQEVVKETPTPLPQQQPQAQPKAPAPANNAITENAAPQEGGDAFNIGAGNGEGMTGGGGAGLFNPGLFNAYFASVVKIAVQKDDTLKNRSFRVAVSIWLSPTGKVTRAELRSSTGSDTYDQALTKLLMGLAPLDQPPPRQILAALPVQMTIDLRKSL